VLVRRAGNESRIAEVEAAFAPVRAEIEAELLAPSRSWQWPVGRVRAAQRYAVILDLMGRSGEARPFYEQVVALGANDRDAVGALLRLARMEAAAGSIPMARRYLERAEEREPGSPRTAQLRAQIGR